MNTGKYLYIPIEIYRRELKGMLILSLIAASKGWKIVMGGKKVFLPNLHKFPEGVVLLKSVVPGEIDTQKLILSHGHKVVSVDAEGLVLSHGEIGATLRYSEESIKLSDVLCFWGKRQFERVKEIFPSIESVGHITGSPVFDFWRYQKFLYNKNPKKNDKKTILIATGFAYPNHIVSEDMARQLLIDTIKKDVSNEKYLDEFLLEGKLQRLVFPIFKKFVRTLIEKYPEYNFILRPHLAENPNPWIEIGKDYDNVTMSLSGEISPLLLESDMLIHFNSTTSIEASYYGKDIVTYIPKADLSEKLYSLYNEDAFAASHVCHTVDEALETIKNVLEGKELDSNLVIGDIIEGCGGEKIYNSSEQIMNALDTVEHNNSSRIFPSKLSILLNSNLIKISIKLRIIWMLGWIDHFTNIFKGKYAPNKDYYTYGKTKQGVLDVNEVRELAENMKRDFGLDDLNIKVDEIREGLITIGK